MRGMKKEEPIRIQKVIADRGLTSRREAERWIEEGRVTVNGKLAGLGDKCVPGQDKITVDGKPLPRKEPEKLTLAVHKPRGYICSNKDPHNSRTIFSLLPPDLQQERLFCVGRLDKDSEGLVILTNDGNLKQLLAHPTYRVIKRYRVKLNQPFDLKDKRKLLNGIVWEGERLRVEKVIPVKSAGKEVRGELEVHMEHGKKREIRRLFYAVGYEVRRLQRFQIGEFPLKGIPRGRAKILTPREVARLGEQPE